MYALHTALLRAAAIGIAKSYRPTRVTPLPVCSGSAQWQSMPPPKHPVCQFIRDSQNTWTVHRHWRRRLPLSCIFRVVSWLDERMCGMGVLREEGTRDAPRAVRRRAPPPRAARRRSSPPPPPPHPPPPPPHRSMDQCNTTIIDNINPILHLN